MSRRYLCTDSSRLYDGLRYREDAELCPRRHHNGRSVCHTYHAFANRTNCSRCSRRRRRLHSPWNCHRKGRIQTPQRCVSACGAYHGYRSQLPASKHSSACLRHKITLHFHRQLRYCRFLRSFDKRLIPFHSRSLPCHHGRTYALYQ